MQSCGSALVIAVVLNLFHSLNNGLQRRTLRYAVQYDGLSI